jgi:hypothetical protein
MVDHRQEESSEDPTKRFRHRLHPGALEDLEGAERPYFQQEVNGVDRVFELIMEDIRVWRAAGCIIAF